MTRMLVAMSGGVDSSVAAALMVEAGHDVIGVTLKQWQRPDGSMPVAGCCTVADAEDARRVAAQLDIPYYVLDYVDEFRRAVVEPFAAAYRAGLTPNPCIECNRSVRFDALLDRTARLGCELLVTGHYARVAWHPAGYRLMRGRDWGKDQSYVLHMLTQAQLARIRLPLGDFTKGEVRGHAVRLGLRTARKRDSQDVCFVDGDYREFLQEHYPTAVRPGAIVDAAGTVLGRHTGTEAFTIGQRRGLGVAAGERRYVVSIDPAAATVTVGPEEDLRVAGCRLRQVGFVSGHPPVRPELAVKVRYRSAPAAARLERDEQGWLVRFDEPHLAVAPGQSAVLYRDDEVLGGGTIAAVLRA